MKLNLKSLCVVYSAGTVGGLANFFFGVLLATFGVFALFGITLPPPPLPAALYQRLVWGGIWGAMVFVPLKGSLWLRGLLMGIPPSVVAGLWVFPAKYQAGLFGVQLGIAMPVFIFLFNWVWGIFTLLVAERSK